MSDNKIYEDLDGYDVQKICRKHNIGRHEVIIKATKIARLGDFTPSEALKKMMAVDNISDYLVKLNYIKLGKSL